ncbi:MAG: peptidase S9 [Saprospiraceae bacterium]|nr:MAG: peptidase S9 [Saprospiraceae bacterium]
MLALLWAGTSWAQKKALTIDDLVKWNQIQYSRISNDGNWVAYSLKAEEGDATLELWSATSGNTWRYPRGEQGTFTEDSRFLVFLIKPFEDSVRAMKRRKVKKDELPNDTLGILELSTRKLVKIPDVKSFRVPERWSGWVAIHLEALKTEPTADTTATPAPDSLKTTQGEQKKKKPAKKENNKNGSRLVLHQTTTGSQINFPFVKDYELAERRPALLFTTTGTEDSTLLQGVYFFDLDAQQQQALLTATGEFKQLSFDEAGQQVAFLANLDTTDARVPPFVLYYWREGLEAARLLADSSASFLPEGWLVSEYAQPLFSEDGQRLFFGMAPPPILQDTSLLDDEIVNVEVWSYTDGLLHTHQKTLLDRERRRSFDVVWYPAEDRFVPLADRSMPEMTFVDERNADVAIGYTEEPYQQLISWEGSPRRDVWLVNLRTGERRQLAKGLRGRPQLSPQARFVYWYSELDSAWFAHDIAEATTRQITTNDLGPFYDERNDVPDYPNAYGIAAWTANDEFVLIYDHFDIWQIDPTGHSAPVNLTNGRQSSTRYRYIRTDPDERFVSRGQRMLLHIFDENTMDSGYGFLIYGAGGPIQLVKGAYFYETSPQKARHAERILFSRENFQTFPDLLYSDLTFRSPRQVSHANPQQAQYRWGKAQLHEWTSLYGEKLRGILVLPEDFDPSKQYPMIVNFYERSSDGLHRHRAPYPHRSTINYSYYVSRGYIIFNPDVPYRIGYPGESCVAAVVPGVTSLIDKGFVDRHRIGVQGHSWGGYQVAYLITKTDLFRCAESGAPVVNMFSAYGGIRWQTGLSRMFQYEHTQSRIGGTIWEYPLRYLENSPLFFLDKVNTPVLIMHNDNDGHVPWYQGIEFFVAMRRLGKPAWLLNYNDEPHWPLKLQNRKDFQLRMSQFFDHYLMDAPKPMWMERGVPAIEKGILQGLEPAPNDAPSKG